MAYLRRLPQSPFWIAGFTMPDGRRTQRSTKLTDRKAAMKMALRWEEAARNRITEAQARRVLSDIHEEIHGTRLATPAVSEYTKQWLERKKGETSAVTLALYKGAAEEFAESLGEKAAQPLHYITPSQVATWRDRAAAKASARTANNKLRIVRVMFQCAWRDGYIPENPAAKVQALKASDGTRRPFTLDELKAVLRVASPEWRGMVLAGLYTGQRLKDVASLTWANVDLERDEIRLATSKTGRRQVIPIAKPLRTHLETLPAGDNPTAPLFPNAFMVATENRDTSPLSQEFYGLLVAVGLAQPRPKKHFARGVGRDGRRSQNEVTFHSLRHTATSLLKRAGVSEAVARDLIGHDSAEISRQYTHVDEAAKRKALAKLPDVTR